jgi:hypothetical protein
MDEFSTYVFQPNELKTENKKVLKERTLLFGIFIALTGYTLYLLDVEYGTPVLMIGVFILIAGRIVMSGKEPSVGHRPMELKIRSNSLLIGTTEHPIEDKGRMLINVIGYRGQGMVQRTAFYKTHNGNENTIRLWHDDKELVVNFVLESEHQLHRLKRFCERHGYKLRI